MGVVLDARGATRRHGTEHWASNVLVQPRDLSSVAQTTALSRNEKLSEQVCGMTAGIQGGDVFGLAPYSGRNRLCAVYNFRCWCRYSSASLVVCGCTSAHTENMSCSGLLLHARISRRFSGLVFRPLKHPVLNPHPLSRLPPKIDMILINIMVSSPS